MKMFVLLLTIFSTGCAFDSDLEMMERLAAEDAVIKQSQIIELKMREGL